MTVKQHQPESEEHLGPNLPSPSTTSPTSTAISKTETNKDWIKIGEYEYDITDFQKKHPGGSIIRYLLAKNGADATETFIEFHTRSTRADKYLAALPKRKCEIDLQATGGNDQCASDVAMLRDFAAFRKELVAKGYFKPSYSHVMYRVIELVMLFAVATYVLSLGYTTLSVVIFGLFGARCGWVQHEGGHSSLTGNIRLDKWIQTFLIGFGLSTSSTLWNSMHNKHHATPQKINHDIDLDTMPFVAFFNTAAETCPKGQRGYSKLWMRFQAFTFIPITSGILVMLFWMYYLHPRKVIRDGKVSDALSMISAHVIRTAVFVYFGGYTIPQSYLLFFLSQFVSGMYLFGHFSLSHTFTAVVDQHENPNWVRFAFEHTVDITPSSSIVSWIMGYLNCQVVHHLFPNMPQFRQPEVSLMLQDFAKKHHIEYTVVTYYEAWKMMFLNLWDVGGHYYHLDSNKKTKET